MEIIADKDLKIMLAQFTLDTFGDELRTGLIAALADEDTETWECMRRLGQRCRDLARVKFQEWERDFAGMRGKQTDGGNPSVPA